jgi:fatty-acyl-CoA synthase
MYVPFTDGLDERRNRAGKTRGEFRAADAAVASESAPPRFPRGRGVVYGRFPHHLCRVPCPGHAAGLGLAEARVAPGDVVATLLPNIPAHAEAHFGVPACGAVLNTINIRLDADTIAYILDHGEAKVVLVDRSSLAWSKRAEAGWRALPHHRRSGRRPGRAMPAHGPHMEYEDLLATGDPDFAWIMPEDEWESLALNYTSGTTGRPKGVVYHHRGAYLMTMGTAISWRMTLHPTLPDHRAAVSLQRLEPHLDDADGGRHGGVLPRHHREGDL